MAYRVNLAKPDIGQREIDAVCEVLKSNWLSLGPKLPEFEQAFAEYLGVKRGVAVNSGTSGLFLCLAAMGIGPGDEVITTPFTFIATVNCIMMVGAKPVMVDIDLDTLNIAADKIEEKITDKTKAIIPVEAFGSPAAFDQICQIAQKHNLQIIEDSCEALGSELNGKKAGTFGKMSVFAFYPNKQITTGEGGMILTDDDELADLCVSMRNQGRAKGGGWLAHERLGYNYRLSDINCAIGTVQLSRIEEFKTKRQQVAAWYEERLGGCDAMITPYEPAGCDINWFVYVIRLNEKFSFEDRNSILEEMDSRGIGVRNYFLPVHLQPFMKEAFGFKDGDYPVTEFVSERTIALPFYSSMTEDEVGIVCKELLEIIANKTK